MIGEAIAGYIGNRVDASDGEGGVKGAAFGWVAASAMRRMGPLGLVAYVANEEGVRSPQGRTACLIAVRRRLTPAL